MLAILFVALISFNSSAQTSHNVNVSDFQFDPAQLTINEGDTVIFTNTNGTHNVNGTVQDFPDNPESFGNSVGSGWTFTFVFNTPGNYDYVCDVHPAMTGRVIVSPVSSVENATSGNAKIQVYPNPATDFVTFDLTETDLGTNAAQITIYNSLGAIVESREVRSTEKVTFSTSELETGIYSFRIQNSETLIQSGSFMTR
jgi:plastocyanin